MKTNYQNARMLDMIFENRNKSYGAYALRNNYNSRISQALLITSSSIILLCFGKFLSDKLKGNHATLSGPIVTLDPIPEVHLEDELKVEPPKEQTPPQAQALNTIRDPEMNVVVNNHIVDSMPTNEQMRDADPGLTINVNENKVGVDDGKGTQQTFTEPPHVTVPEPVRLWAEVMPVFPGGENKLMEFLRNKTSFPEMERDLEMEGKALVKFVVNEDGSISNVQVVKTDSRGFGKEAVRVVSLMPKFIPGSQQGKPVKVQFVLPFQFKLAH